MPNGDEMNSSLQSTHRPEYRYIRQSRSIQNHLQKDSLNESNSSQHWKQKWTAIILVTTWPICTESSAYSYMIVQDVGACSVLQYNELTLLKYITNTYFRNNCQKHIFTKDYLAWLTGNTRLFISRILDRLVVDVLFIHENIWIKVELHF